MSHTPFLQKSSWQKALADLITDPKELLTLLELETHWLPEMEKAARSFPLRIPREYAARLKKGDINDPILKQILPIGMELNQLPFYSLDPLQEKKMNPIPGLLHKYQGRVLITLTGACAIHCRYCFRRHFPYDENQPGTRGLKKIIDYIAEDVSISEVILSGGDPLAVNDSLLKTFSLALNDILHVKRLRLHTRLPVILPSRVTESLIEWFRQLKQQAIVVFHINHPQEINQEVKDAALKLYDTRVTLLNQAVLLKNINDQVDILAELSEQLFSARILPYYLHLLDKVAGAAHFDLERCAALNLHQGLLERLPGYLVPKLVQEVAGEMSKSWVF